VSFGTRLAPLLHDGEIVPYVDQEYRVGGEDQNTIPDFINCSYTTEKAMKKSQPSPFTRSKAVQPPDQILERIRQRAYEMYELRGKDGYDLDDWLRAESEVTQNFGV
jgi:hypothetical protein